MTDGTEAGSQSFQTQSVRLHRWDSSGAAFISLRLIMAISAMLIGAIAVVLGRLVRVYYLEPSGLELSPGGHNLRPIFDFCFSYMMCKLFGATFGNSFPLAGRFRVVGVWATLILMHNLVWWYPDMAAAIYSPDYVEEVKDSTAPETVYAITQYVSFSDLFAKEEPPAPGVEPEAAQRQTPEFFRRADAGLRLGGFRDPVERTGRERLFQQAH